MFKCRCFEGCCIDGLLVGCCSSLDIQVLIRDHLGDSRKQSSLNLCMLKLHLLVAASNNLIRLTFWSHFSVDTRRWLLQWSVCLRCLS